MVLPQLSPGLTHQLDHVLLYGQLPEGLKEIKQSDLHHMWVHLDGGRGPASRDHFGASYGLKTRHMPGGVHSATSADRVICCVIRDRRQANTSIPAYQELVSPY
jgi:hypothetical protein